MRLILGLTSGSSWLHLHYQTVEAKVDLLDKININVIQPVSKVIFGTENNAVTNSSITLKDGHVWNSHYQLFNYTRPRLTLTQIEPIEELTILDGTLTHLEVHHSLPAISNETSVMLETLMFTNLTGSINETHLLSSLNYAQTVKILHSQIENFSNHFIDQLIHISSTRPELRLIVLESWWSCDCQKRALLEKGPLAALEVVCRLPGAVRGVDFWDLSSSQLHCEPISSVRSGNVEAVEYHPSSLSCSATGYPLPKVSWRSPGGQRLDRAKLVTLSTEYRETFSIDERIIQRNNGRKYAFESRLSVNSVDKRS